MTRPIASRRTQHGLAGGNLGAAGMSTSGSDFTGRATTHAPSERLRRHGCPSHADAAHQRGQSAFRITLFRGQWELTAKAYASQRQQQQWIRKTASKFLLGRGNRRAGRSAGAIRVTRQTATILRVTRQLDTILLWPCAWGISRGTAKQSLQSKACHRASCFLLGCTIYT